MVLKYEKSKLEGLASDKGLFFCVIPWQKDKESERKKEVKLILLYEKFSTIINPLPQ
jgi:hypothetical protein